MKKTKSILLDVMVDNRCVCQLEYNRFYPIMLDDGTPMDCVSAEDIQKFIEEKRPSLKYQKYHVEFSNQKV